MNNPNNTSNAEGHENPMPSTSDKDSSKNTDTAVPAVEAPTASATATNASLEELSLKEIISLVRCSDWNKQYLALEDLETYLKKSASKSSRDENPTSLKLISEILSALENGIKSKISKISTICLKLLSPFIVSFQSRLTHRHVGIILNCIFPKVIDSKNSTRKTAESTVSLIMESFDNNILCAVSILISHHLCLKKINLLKS